MDKYQIAITNMKTQRIIVRVFTVFLCLTMLMLCNLVGENLFTNLFAKKSIDSLEKISSLTVSIFGMGSAVLVFLVIKKLIKHSRKISFVINEISFGNTKKELFKIIKKSRSVRKEKKIGSMYQCTYRYELETENQRGERKTFHIPMAIFDSVINGEVVTIEHIDGYDSIIDMIKDASSPNAKEINIQDINFWIHK